MTDMPIRRALISVFDKSGLIPFATTLTEAGVEIISTGGTAKALKDAGIGVTELGAYTGFPEMLGGRVKTLHPKIHGGLLYIRGDTEHEKTAKEHGIQPIDLVVVNLYPFEKTAAKEDATPQEVIENIDIGGPSMIRSAAKNHASVTVVVDPSDYAAIAETIRESGSVSMEKRRALAGKAFVRTASYDTAIARYFAKDENTGPSEMLFMQAPLVQKLRYGENPHQKAALYGRFNEYYRQLQGKELSYNNILDLTAAAELVSEFRDEMPTVVILKHMNPCGVGRAAKLSLAWTKAFATDTQAPFGGIIAANVEFDLETAEAIKELFCEVAIAPSFSDEALAILKEKKNLRLMVMTQDPRKGKLERVRSVGAETYLVQETDSRSLSTDDVKVVTRRAPSDDEMEAMLFGWKVVKHVKSNAILYVALDRTLGVGAGQMSRIDASKLAVWKAKEAGLSLQGSAVASDAFFPFPDGLIAAAEAGATAVIQPGGSLRDLEVIAAADERGMAMVFTRVRHFRH